MTDRYVFNPDIHEDWAPPAHRCGNCAHHEHEVVEVERIAKDGSELAGPTEGTCCYCTTCLYYRFNGCANADRQKDWMHYRVWKGLEQCPSWWLDQNRFERA
jgi:hypothetical protein